MLEIRPATEEDLPFILSLYAQPGFDDGVILDLGQARTLFARMRTYPDYKLYVAVEDAQVVGTFALLIMDNLGHQGTPSAVIEDVVVGPDQQGKGVGRQMMAFAMEKGRQAGCYKLALTTNLKRERAHRFYESLGFVKHGYSYSIELKGRA